MKEENVVAINGDRIREILKREVNNNRFSGMIWGVTSNEVEEHISVGKIDVNKEKLMDSDTIFRIYSMSKPICAVAINILIERGLLSLNDVLSDYLPEFTNMKVYNGNNIEDARTPIRISNLLNMTAGFSYDGDDMVGMQTGKLFEKIHQCMDEHKVFTTRMVIEELAKQPLAFEPGEKWGYGLCADVLGAVLEEVTGRRLSVFYHEEIFEPLGMKDTGFFVPKEKQNRFAVLYDRTVRNGRYVLKEDNKHHLGLGDFLQEPGFESAGAGLVSTYDDYIRFVQMLANGGSLGKIRILKEETVKQFTQNQMTSKQMKGIYFPQMKGYGYGNLMRVRLFGKEAMVPGESDSFGWDGWSGPYMAIDYEHKKGVLMFTQLSAYSDWDVHKQILHNIVMK